MSYFADVRYVFLPYCIEFLDDGGYIVLNREYKPLGGHPWTWVDYDTHPSVCRDGNLTPAMCRKWGLHEVGVGYFYFYSDDTKPIDTKANWQRYSKLLEKFAKVLWSDTNGLFPQPKWVRQMQAQREQDRAEREAKHTHGFPLTFDATKVAPLTCATT